MFRWPDAASRRRVFRARWGRYRKITWKWSLYGCRSTGCFMPNKWKIACQKGLGVHPLQAVLWTLRLLVGVLINQSHDACFVHTPKTKLLINILYVLYVYVLFYPSLWRVLSLFNFFFLNHQEICLLICMDEELS